MRALFACEGVNGHGKASYTRCVVMIDLLHYGILGDLACLHLPPCTWSDVKLCFSS